MTRIYEFLIALGIVAVLALVIGLVLPSHRHISESVETNRKMTIVYDTVNNLRRFKDWNPLVLRDPQMQLNVTGPEAGVGARLDYVSNEGRIGKGSWEIVDSVPNEKVVIKVEDPASGGVVGADAATALLGRDEEREQLGGLDRSGLRRHLRDQQADGKARAPGADRHRADRLRVPLLRMPDRRLEREQAAVEREGHSLEVRLGR